MKLRKGRFKLKEWLLIYTPLLVTVGVAFWLASKFVQPAPPDRIVIAAGEPGGAYSAFARRYAELLLKQGLTLEVLHTRGAAHNLQLLKQGKVDLAFLQGGVAKPSDISGRSLKGMGSLYYEPLWLFHRKSLAISRMTQLRGVRVSIGQQGSGTHALVLQLMEENGIQTEDLQLLELAGTEAMNSLLSGEIDAAFFVSSPQSPIIKRLLHDPQVELMSFRRAEAYARRYDFLTTLLLPEGAEDLANNIPGRDTHLLATTTGMLTHDNLHPAIVMLMMQVLSKVHGQRSWFAEKGEFPNAHYMEFPLHEVADRYFRHGAPFLQRYLPFWLASFLDRMKIMILPLLGLLLPLFKILPPLYQWRMRARVYRWYSQLEEIDHLVAQPNRDVAQLEQRLDQLDREVREIKIPLSFFQQLYHLRLHIDFVRKKLAQ